MRMGIRFGAFLFQVVDYPLLLDDARFAQQLGLDNLWIADHVAWAPRPEMPILEAWTTLAALSAGTKAIRLGPLVSNVATRNPAMLAKHILTVDQISGGRLDVGLGAGYFKKEHEAIGLDFLDGPGRADRFREAVEILDRALRGEHVTYSGTHYTFEDAPMHPGPTQRPRPPLWIAARGPRSLRVVARHGDALVTMGEGTTEQSLAALQERMTTFESICHEVGRDPSTIRRCFLAGVGEERIFESDDSLTDFIGRFAEAGVTDFAFSLNNPAQPATASMVTDFTAATRDQFERAAADIFPRFQKAAAHAR
jgi:alkanesulfonate monooxygenase SsuD/methylene tetrahydromethanopterin reductase-like flavin-dependent oxidoreductase (luciferase family)